MCTKGEEAVRGAVAGEPFLQPLNLFVQHLDHDDGLPGCLWTASGKASMPSAATEGCHADDHIASFDYSVQGLGRRCVSEAWLSFIAALSPPSLQTPSDGPWEENRSGEALRGEREEGFKPGFQVCGPLEHHLGLLNHSREEGLRLLRFGASF